MSCNQKLTFGLVLLSGLLFISPPGVLVSIVWLVYCAYFVLFVVVQGGFLLYCLSCLYGWVRGMIE
jgi:hypothetical protein